MPRNTIGFEGLESLGRKLRAMPDDLAGATLLNAALEGAEIIREEMVTLAPRRAKGGGRLKREIRKEVRSAKRDKTQIDIGPSQDAFYGVFFETGTKHMAARPFMRPAYDSKHEEAAEKTRDMLRKRVEAVARGP